jgi:hypothetical protein
MNFIGNVKRTWQLKKSEISSFVSPFLFVIAFIGIFYEIFHTLFEIEPTTTIHHQVILYLSTGTLVAIVFRWFRASDRRDNKHG